MEIRGGVNRQGEQSILRLPSIVACDGKVHNDPSTHHLRINFSPRSKHVFVCGGKLGLSASRSCKPLQGREDIGLMS